MLGHSESEHDDGLTHSLSDTLLQKPGSTVRGRRANKRHVFALLAHLGMLLAYTFRIDLSPVAEPMQAAFGWTNVEQGYVLSAFFFGYFPFQIPAALAAQHFGAKLVFGIGVLGPAVLTLMMPLCAPWLWLLCSMRALMGIIAAGTYPSLVAMFSHWVPRSERATICAFCFAGAYSGSALAMPAAGTLVALREDYHGISTSWPCVFYVFGGIGCIWFIFWQLFLTNTPAQHKSISPAELAFLEAETEPSIEGSSSVPWLCLLTNPAALAIYINHFAYSYGFYTMMTFMPKFLDEQLGTGMDEAGLVAFFPYVLLATVSIVSGGVSDRLVKRWPVRWVRTCFHLGGMAVSGGLLATLGFITDNESLAVAAMTLSVGLSGMCIAGYSPAYIDHSPRYASQMYSIGNTIANSSGVIAPIVAGHLLNGSHGEASAVAWRNVFYVPVGLYAIAAVLWVSFVKFKPISASN